MRSGSRLGAYLLLNIRTVAQSLHRDKREGPHFLPDGEGHFGANALPGLQVTCGV